MNNRALIIFAKNIIAGHVKTRLAATLGNETAIDIYKQLIQHTNTITNNIEADKIVFYSEFIEDDIWQNIVYKKQIQEGNSLGIKMGNAFKTLFIDGYEKAILIGTDCPGINEIILNDAFAKLNEHDIVLGPAKDGGYYLIGMKKENSNLFHNISWSTNQVLKQTIELCYKNLLSYFLLPELSDIDEEKDLIHLESLLLLNKKKS